MGREVEIASPTRRAAARSSLYRLQALAFGHPVPELHRQMADGRFRDAYGMHLATLDGYGKTALPLVRRGFARFESEFIAFFHVGPSGRPRCPLTEGDYDLGGGETRSTLMLEFIQLYRWFGLKVRTEGEEQELPDHLTCQLEFMAYLTHRESEALARGLNAGPYQRAQRDVIGRHLGKLVAVVAAGVKQAEEDATLDSFLPSLARALRRLVAAHQRELTELVGAYGGRLGRDESTAAAAGQDMWGAT